MNGRRPATGLDLLMRALVATLAVGIPFACMVALVWVIVHVIL